MNETAHEAANVVSSLGLVLTKIAAAFLAKEVIVLLVSSAAVAGMMYFMLEFFANPDSIIKPHISKLTKDEKSAYVTSIMMILAGIIPMLIVIVPIFAGQGNGFGIDGANVLIAAGFAIVLMFLIGLRLKFLLKCREWFPLGEAVNTIAVTTGKHIADWIGAAVIGFVRMIIKALHKPFVLNYVAMLFVLHIAANFGLLLIMGRSAESAGPNILGTTIGCVIHFAIRRKAINKMADEYRAENTTEVKPT